MLGSFRHIIIDSLFRNSAFLVFNTSFGAACGCGALGLLTRLYSVRAIGLAAAALSASGLIASVTQFGANYTLLRFHPVSRHRAALINTVVTVTMRPIRNPVVSDLPGLADLPDQAVLGCNGWVPALITALTRLARADSEILAAMSVAAYGYASRTTWQEIAERTMAEILAVLGNVPDADLYSRPVIAP